MSNLEGQVSTLDGRMSNLEDQVSTLQSDMSEVKVMLKQLLA